MSDTGVITAKRRHVMLSGGTDDIIQQCAGSYLSTSRCAVQLGVVKTGMC